MLHRQSFSSPGERAGLAVIATAGLSSALATSSLLAYIVWNTFLTRDKNSPLHRGIRSFTRSTLGHYLISLLLCDLLQGSAFALNYRWAVLGEMVESKICTTQGSISEVGDLGAAIWSLAIGVHTFFLLFLVKKPPRITAPIILTLGWTILIVLPIVGPTVIQTAEKGSFYSLSGAWCWIGKGYNAERLIYLYMWIFIALGSSFVVYTLIYLRFSNFITVGEKGKLSFHFRHQRRPLSVSASQIETRTSHRGSTNLPGCFDWTRDTRDGTVTSGTASGSEQATNSMVPVSKHLKQVAQRLMWYPILYTLVVVPVSVCRMGVLAGWQPPFGLYVFAGITFGGSGISNVILFITTRHSFIKHVALDRGTRVRVTTHRVTVREDGGGDFLELDHIKTDSTRSPTTPKSPYSSRFEDEGCFNTVNMAEKVVVMSQDQDSENYTVEEGKGIHVTVMAV